MVLKMLERANTRVFKVNRANKRIFFIYKEGESALYVRDGDSSKSRTRFKNTRQNLRLFVFMSGE